MEDQTKSNQRISSPLLPNADPEKAILEMVNSSNLYKLTLFLNSCPQVLLTKIKDDRLYSLLHISCVNDQIDMCKFLIEYISKKNFPEDEIKEWVNLKNNQGFTAIHFASSRGNLRLINLLEQYGADIHQVNNTGLNVVHMAAQGDQPLSIAYFLEKGFDIQAKDNNAFTPLHWAAYSGAENCTYYLISCKALLNEKESASGSTPLHLAVNSENPKVVRKLLLNGADPRIRNNEGKLPLDIAIENDYKSMIPMLKGRNYFVECFHIKPPLKKRKDRAVLVFMILMILTLIVFNFMFLCPFIEGYGALIYFICLSGLIIIIYMLTWLTNPGRIENKENGDLLKLLAENSKTNVCYECKIRKPERSKHCEYCGTCIPVHDHHCPWVNNCIGMNNYRYFVMLIMLAPIALISITVLAALKIKSEDPGFRYYEYYVADEETLGAFKLVACILNFALTSIFLIPLFGLNWLHWTNIRQGKTTSERFGLNQQKESGRSFESSFSEERYVSISEPSRTHECIQNCWNMCFKNSRNPKYNSTASEKKTTGSVQELQQRLTM